MVYYFKSTTKAKRTILAATDSLFNWCSPYLPDDLCFLKDDKEWLITTSHERLCYITAENKDEIDTIKNMNGLISIIYR